VGVSDLFTFILLAGGTYLLLTGLDRVLRSIPELSELLSPLEPGDSVTPEWLNELCRAIEAGSPTSKEDSRLLTGTGAKMLQGLFVPFDPRVTEKPEGRLFDPQKNVGPRRVDR
jgi:hypothetical protein